MTLRAVVICWLLLASPLLAASGAVATQGPTKVVLEQSTALDVTSREVLSVAAGQKSIRIFLRSSDTLLSISDGSARATPWRCSMPDGRPVARGWGTGNEEVLLFTPEDLRSLWRCDPTTGRSTLVARFSGVIVAVAPPRAGYTAVSWFDGGLRPLAARVNIATGELVDQLHLDREVSSVLPSLPGIQTPAMLIGLGASGTSLVLGNPWTLEFIVVAQHATRRFVGAYNDTLIYSEAERQEKLARARSPLMRDIIEQGLEVRKPFYSRTAFAVDARGQLWAAVHDGSGGTRIRVYSADGREVLSAPVPGAVTHLALDGERLLTIADSITAAGRRAIVRTFRVYTD